MATNVPIPSLSDTGFSVPDEGDILAGVFADFQAAFGGNLNQALNTPQGQLASSIAAMLGSSFDLFALLVSQVDPAFSGGRMQDAIARIYFLTRNPPLPTIVAVTLTGAPGTFIPEGSLAQATDGSQYQNQGDVTIGTGGTVSATFASLQTGPVSCPAGTLNRVYRAIPGWDAITNAADGILGRDVESRVDFEARRSASVALNAVGILPAIRGAVLSVDNVIDAFVTENSTASSMTVGGVTLAPHSLYVAVQGGTDGDVARAIWRKKNPGCDYNGNTTIIVEDQSSGYVPPYPTYNVTFQRPSSLPIYFAVQIANSSAVPSNAQDLIRAAIAEAFNGQDGGSRVRIGTAVYASRFYAGIAALGSWAQVVSVNVGTSASPTGDSVAVNIDQFPTLNTGNIAVSLV